MIDSTKLCMGCMSRREGSGPCPNCGFDESQPQENGFLPLRTFLCGRYVVGRSIYSNGESITYLGYDCKTDAPVQIQEYMPAVLCGRRMDGSISINEGSETNYKTLMLEYEGILKTLRQQGRLSGIIPVVDTFHEKNTVYGVFQKIQTVPLGKFLTRCGGELNWSRVKKMFIPLLNTLVSIHNAGIIHRGISPETVLIDKQGNLWLSGFSTVALRTNQSEIEPELFSGYAAPEQYDPSGLQGPWTDVYAVGAVMYKALTGTMPPQSTTRRINDNLLPCDQLNSSVPQNVSDVIASATEYHYSRRTQSIEEMLSGLLQAAESRTSIYVANKGESSSDFHLSHELRQDKRANDGPAPVPVKKVYSRSHSALYAVLSMLITFGILGYVMLRFIESTTSAEEPSSSSSSSGLNIAAGPTMAVGGEVPNFIGMTVDMIQSTAIFSDNYLFSIREEENDDAAEGIVFDQSPAPKTPMQNKGTVVLYVSKGSPMIPMPNVQGRTIDEAVQILNAAGFTSDNYQVIESFEEGEEGKVLRTNIAPDTPVRKNKDKIMLIIRSKDMSSSSSEPEEPEEPDEEESSSSSGKRRSSTASGSTIIIIPRKSSSSD